MTDGPNGVVVSDGKTIYATTSGNWVKLKSVYEGKTWKESDLETSGYAIAVSPQDSERVLFAKSDGLHLSTNGFNSSKKVL